MVQKQAQEAMRLLRAVVQKNKEQAGTIEGLRRGNATTRAESERLHGENDRLTQEIKRISEEFKLYREAYQLNILIPEDSSKTDDPGTVPETSPGDLKEDGEQD